MVWIEQAWIERQTLVAGMLVMTRSKPGRCEALIGSAIDGH